jgi:Na+(H+)/acetate symporter ActP
MQFFILFIGAMVFVFYLFVEPPMLFQRAELARIEPTAAYLPVAQDYQQAFGERRAAALGLVAAHKAGDAAAEKRQVAAYRAAQRQMDQARARAANLVSRAGGPKEFSDTNYIFLTFVTRYLPVGLVGLVIAVIFAATMSSSSGEINSLATVTIVDLYRRHFRRNQSDHHYLNASRWATLFWGSYAVAFAGFGNRLGPLIVAVNVVGSLFYGSLLGCFVLAFGFPRVRGTAAFAGMLAGEAAIFAAFLFSRISWLWYNAIGCLVVMAVALAITWLSPTAASATPATQPAR